MHGTGPGSGNAPRAVVAVVTSASPGGGCLVCRITSRPGSLLFYEMTRVRTFCPHLEFEGPEKDVGSQGARPGSSLDSQRVGWAVVLPLASVFPSVK